MADKKDKGKVKEKFSVRLKNFIHNHRYLLGVLGAIFVFVFGVVLVADGGYQYYRATRQSLVVAAIHSIEEGDIRKAQSLLMRAAANNTPEAYTYLAWISARSGNFTKALEYCRECAKYPGIYGGYEIMGYLSLLGYGHALGAGSAVYFFDEALKGYTDAELLNSNPLLKMNEYGIGLCMNTQDYVRMVDEAVKQGSINALLLRGDIDFLGEQHDISPNSASKSWEQAYKNGLVQAESRIAGLLWHGYGRNRDYKEAMRLYEDAAIKDDPIANYSLGLIKFREKNNNAYTEGMSYMRTAAKRKYGPALTAVGVMALTNNPRKPKIISASADIFRQAYEAGDPTGGILYGLMLIIGAGVEQDSTLGFSIFYDLKNRGYESINPLLSYYTYTTDVDTKLLFKQILRVIYKQYVGDLCFAEGAPEAVDYLDSNRNSTMSFYKKQKDDIHRFSFDLLQKLGKNLVINLDDPEQVTIDGLPLLFPEISKMLEMYNPTTGAKHFMPKMVLSIEASVPRLPKDYDKFELDLDSLADKF